MNLSRRLFCVFIATIGFAIFLWFAVFPTTAEAQGRSEDENAQIRLIIRDASRALQAGNAALFFSAFDRRYLAGLGGFRQQVEALTAQRRIGSSVENGPVSVEGEERQVTVDWLLQLTRKLDPGPVEIRRQNINMRLAMRKCRWQIVSIEPVEFFRAL